MSCFQQEIIQYRHLGIVLTPVLKCPVDISELVPKCQDSLATGLKCPMDSSAQCQMSWVRSVLGSNSEVSVNHGNWFNVCQHDNGLAIYIYIHSSQVELLAQVTKDGYRNTMHLLLVRHMPIISTVDT